MNTPITEILEGLVVAIFLVLLVIISISDVRNRRIPNWTVLAILMLAVPWILLAPAASFISSGEAMLVAFLISFPLYLAGVVGAGDSKFLAAAAVWVGAANLMLFLVIVGLTGGMVAAVSLLRNPNRALVMLQMRGKGDFGRGVPYGVAIAVGAAAVTARQFAYPLFR